MAMPSPWKVVFMGTPSFAVPSLDALIHNEAVAIATVVTQPDQPKGRGLTLTSSPVKQKAQEAGLPLLQPEKIRTPEFLERIRALEPDLIVVVAYGKILPKDLLSIPPLGTINVHGSLLPKYRGAAPVQWAIINGEKETGVTIMLLDEGMDTGPVLLMEETAIEPTDTSGSLRERLAGIGAKALVRALDGMRGGTVVPRPQPDAGVSYAPILKKKDGMIDWKKPAGELSNLIRGLDPWPGSYSGWRGKLCHLYRPQVADVAVQGEPGEVLRVDDSGLLLATGQGCIHVAEIKMEGGRRMRIADFRRGHPIGVGEKLG